MAETPSDFTFFAQGSACEHCLELRISVTDDMERGRGLRGATWTTAMSAGGIEFSLYFTQEEVKQCDCNRLQICSESPDLPALREYLGLYLFPSCYALAGSDARHRSLRLAAALTQKLDEMIKDGAKDARVQILMGQLADETLPPEEWSRPPLPNSDNEAPR